MNKEVLRYFFEVVVFEVEDLQVDAIEDALVEFFEVVVAEIELTQVVFWVW